jgi:sulfoxide reductase heme-binding subunit YedZ
MLLPTALKPAKMKQLKAILFALALLPLARLIALGMTDKLGANPVEFVIRSTGTWALSFLLITLAITPLRSLTGASWLVALRRMLGLYAFFYACLHATGYLWIDQWFDWTEIFKDIAKRPFITVGVATFIALIPLAATSTNAMMRRLGRNWKTLHQLSYYIAMTGVLHYFWLVKKDITQPLIYAAVLAILLGVRLMAKVRSQRRDMSPAL